MKPEKLNSNRENGEFKSIYKNIFELSPTPTAIFNPEGYCCLANMAFYLQLGYEISFVEKETIHIREIFKNAKAYQAFLKLLEERDVLRRWETTIKTLSGDHFPILLSGRKMIFRGEEHIEISFINISPQKQIIETIRRGHNRLSSLMDNLTAGLFLVNRRDIITEANTALGNLTGKEPEELVDNSYQYLFSILISLSLEPEVVQHILREAVQNIMTYPEQIIRLKEGKRHVEVKFFPVWDTSGAPLGWGGLVQDVTEMREQAAWKMELLSMLAHDLRTPLATLKGNATALLANYHQWGSEMSLEFLRTINRSVDELIRQVDRNLALTRVESGQLGLRPEAITPLDLVNQAIERAAGSLGEVPVEVELTDDSSKLRVDPARAEEVIINLLDNAARFSPEGKQIFIKGETLTNMYKFSIIDQGPGIPSERVNQIFEKYVRGVGREGGTGLGLYISRKIVEAHGGRIWVATSAESLSSGAVFRFTLPLMPAILKEHNLPDEDKKTSLLEEDILIPDGEKILVVEDEVDVQSLLHTILTQEGYQVEVAPDGRFALDLLQAWEPDLVLLDWMLPGMSGLTVCRNIRRWSNLPIIVVTSRTAQQDLTAALDAGADDYVTKPFISDELLARIRALLRRGKPSHYPTEEHEQFRAKELIVDYSSRSVILNGDRLQLTPTEYQILAYMTRHRNRVITYNQLIDHLWGVTETGSRHSLFVHISRLREKLEQDPKKPDFIQTKWGVGYIFMPD